MSNTNPGEEVVAFEPERLQVEFCDEWTNVEPPGPFLIGREGDLAIDDNPYLHRSFLSIRWDQFWWIDNVGAALAATVSDEGGTMHSWLSRGASLPVLFPVTAVRFTAGPTSYGISLHLTDAPMTSAGTIVSNHGTTTLRPASLTDNQRQLVLSLAEPSLLAERSGVSVVPSSGDAAKRLGWTQTKFNRQLDAVCQKLARTGVRGLHGEPGRLASNRRARLVEYALAIRLVTPEDLPLLDHSLDEGAADR